MRLLRTTAVTTDWKPFRRVRDPDLMRMLKLEYDCCELTGHTTGLHLHHVVLKSQGGDDVRSNIVCIRDDAHTRYHAHDPVVRRLLAEHLLQRRPDVTSYLRDKLGEEPAIQWMHSHLQT